MLIVGGARSATPASGLIAFTRYDGIYAMRADGTGVRALRIGGVASSAFRLAWSPDGSRLAFAAYEGNQTAIWVMRANGTGLSRLAVGGEIRSFGSPTWSPDGQRIAFTAVRGWEKDRDIWLVNADGSHLRRLARTPRLWETDVDWSRAGGRMAFTSGGYVPLLYVMNANGKNPRKLLVPQQPSGTPRAVLALEPRWSPEGRRIASSSGGTRTWRTRSTSRTREGARLCS